MDKSDSCRRSFRRNRRSEPDTKLNEGFSRSWRAYAAAAGAAGVGVLLTGQSAQADIVVTTAHSFVNPSTTISLDLNHDGIADFQLGQSLGTFFSPTMVIKGLEPGDAVQGFVSFYDFIPHTVASRLSPGASIGSAAVFKKKAILGEARCCFATYYYGPWAHGGNGFLGLRFTIGGQVHYGWIELNVHDFYQTRDDYGELVVSYAYDTVANQGIFAGEGFRGANLLSDAAPEPGTLGLLALGSLGLGFWQRKRQTPGVE